MQAGLPAENRFLVDRFCGHELFPVVEVEVFLREDEPILNLEIHCGRGLERTVPKQEYIGEDNRPMADVWIPLPGTSPADLAGLTLTIRPEDLEPYYAECTFSYYETEDLRDVVVRFSQVHNGALRLVISGRTQDPNHYDGSKPDAHITIDTWMLLPEPEDS